MCTTLNKSCVVHLSCEIAKKRKSPLDINKTILRVLHLRKFNKFLFTILIVIIILIPCAV